jgi:DNA-binding CsgD family transcriptional regulator
MTVAVLSQRCSSSTGIDALLASATREVLVMSRLLGAVRDPIARVRGIDHENLRRGVRYRVVLPDTARAMPVLANRFTTLALSGADIRTVASVPADALVVDGSIVVLPASSAGTALFRLPSVVRPNVELFECVWPAAVPMSACELPRETEITPRERKLLTLLFHGSTDEAAAIRLDVSVRTVRRMVAELMDRLGARSRFQAGAKAADRGWLLERAC